MKSAGASRVIFSQTIDKGLSLKCQSTMYVNIIPTYYDFLKLHSKF